MASNAETVDHDCAERVEELSLEDNTSFRKSEFATKISKTNLVFVFGDKKLYVSSAVIEMCSPVFEQMISEKVKNEQGLIVLEIPDCSVEDFEDFLTCFYPGKKHKLSESNVFLILPLAHKFGVEVVIQLCESQLLYMIHRDTTSSELLSECLSLAYTYNLEMIKQQAFEIYKVKQKDDFKDICIPLPKNHEARAAILEACLSEFILTENKCAFLHALVPKLFRLEMSNFASAYYSALKINVKQSIFGCAIKNQRDTIDLCGLTFKFESERKPVSMSFHLGLVDAQSVSTDTRTSMAVLYRLHNLSNLKEDIYLVKQFNGLEKVVEKSRVSVDPKMLEFIESEFTIDGMFSMTIHVLMDKPVHVGQ